MNVTIRNVSCDGRVAGVAIGSEMSGGVENVTVERVHFVRANGAAHIKTGQTRGGYVTNVRFANLTFADGAYLTEGGGLRADPARISARSRLDPAATSPRRICTRTRARTCTLYHPRAPPRSRRPAVLVDAHYGSANPSCPGTWQPAPPRMANYTFEHIYGRNAYIHDGSPFHFQGSDGSDITGVVVRDVHFPPGVHHSNWYCGHVAGEAVNGTVEPWPPCSGFKVVPVAR